MQPAVRVISTGGTIASTAGEDGAAPEKSGEQLVEAVPALDELAELSVTDVASVPGFDVSPEVIARMGEAIVDAEEDGVDAVIVTHGTDTMEESAYWLDLALDATIPVVLTGAQRRSDEIGFDGYANLLTAVRAAVDERFRNAGGVYLAFNDEIHAARDVTKTHTSALETFASPGKGPVAHLTRDSIEYYREPGSRSVTIPVFESDARVEQIKTGVGVDGGAIDRAVDGGADGLVVEGTGLGNVTAELGEAIERAIAGGVPVVITSRCVAGSVAAVYGTEGGGVTLAHHGVIPGADLPAHKARIKLMLALAASDDFDEIEEYFPHSTNDEP